MDYLEKFRLPLAELPEGEHHYDYVIDDVFFEHFELSEIKRANLNFNVWLHKFEDMISMSFHFEGIAKMICDRCSDTLLVPLQGDEKLIIKFGGGAAPSGLPEKNEDSGEIIFLPVLQNDFDISHYIYENLNLALPASRVHKEGECNKEMLQQLEKHAAGSASEKHPDPRWQALRNIKISDN